MSKQEFIQNLRTARNLLVHAVHSENPVLSTSDIKPSVAGAAIWLTPVAVAGFDAADFPELPEASRSELERNVREFREVAETVPDHGPADAQQQQAGLRAFMNILQIMDRYIATTDEVRRLQNAMKRVHFPAEVLTWEFEFGQDSSGDPAVWIWVVVDDAAAADPHFAMVSTRLQRAIREELQAEGLDKWPYLRFRTKSEQRALRAVGQ